MRVRVVKMRAAFIADRKQLNMRCNIIFNLDDPEDAAHHLRCTKALDLTLCLNEFRTQLFSKLKYDEMTKKERQAYADISNLLNETLEEYGIHLDELNR